MAETMTSKVETIVSAENQREAEEVLEFLNTLTQDEKKNFLIFIRGVKFASNMNISQSYQYSLN